MGAAGLRHTSEEHGWRYYSMSVLLYCVVCAEIPRVTFTAKAVHAGGLSSSAL